MTLFLTTLGFATLLQIESPTTTERSTVLETLDELETPTDEVVSIEAEISDSDESEFEEFDEEDFDDEFDDDFEEELSDEIDQEEIEVTEEDLIDLENGEDIDEMDEDDDGFGAEPPAKEEEPE